MADIYSRTQNKTESIKDFVVRIINSILGETEDDGFFLDRLLMEMGLDSNNLFDIVEKLSHKFRIPITPPFLFKYDTAQRIISYFQEHDDSGQEYANPIIQEAGVPGKNELEDDDGGDDSNDAPGQPKDIAIIGISCRLPGGINNKEQLWSLLINNKAAIRKMPLHRLIWPSNINPENEHKGIDMVGSLDEIDGFDPLFFRIHPKEADYIDPQQRIMLELSWKCREDAGYSAKTLFGSNTGAFIGASSSDYGRLFDSQTEKIESYFSSGTSVAIIPNRISYFYDFHGPSIQIDTACSSSLVAIHEAIESLRQKACEQALVGGVNIICHPATSISFYKAGMLSKDGMCKTFDKDANGYVRGEGAVMLLLKPLDRALCDRDSIYAVIKGSAINHGGQASGLTVPNPKRQAVMLVEAFKKAGIEPETVGYIETHGTGTPLGDPIEISGLIDAFSQLSKEKEKAQDHYCGLGSIKTNIATWKLQQVWPVF